MRYRSLRGYKYQLLEDWSVMCGVRGYNVTVPGGWLSLSLDGYMTFQAGYCWDGPSGPTWDTEAFIIASLPHDGGYQLIREGYLPAETRKAFDDDLYWRCREWGMSGFRAWYVHKAVRAFGGLHC